MTFLELLSSVLRHNKYIYASLQHEATVKSLLWISCYAVNCISKSAGWAKNFKIGVQDILVHAIPLCELSDKNGEHTCRKEG